MWAGADWAWHEPVLRNQAISTEAGLKDPIEYDTKFAGRAIQQIYHVNFFNPDGDPVAEADNWCFRRCYRQGAAATDGDSSDRVGESSAMAM